MAMPKKEWSAFLVSCMCQQNFPNCSLQCKNSFAGIAQNSYSEQFTKVPYGTLAPQGKQRLNYN